MAEFSERLTKLMDNRDLNGKEFGDLMGVSKQSVSHWRSGVSKPDTKKLEKIAGFFGVTLDFLLGYSDREYETEDQAALRNIKKVIDALPRSSDDRMGGEDAFHPDVVVLLMRALGDFLSGADFEYTPLSLLEIASQDLDSDFKQEFLKILRNVQQQSISLRVGLVENRGGDPINAAGPKSGMAEELIGFILSRGYSASEIMRALELLEEEKRRRRRWPRRSSSPWRFLPRQAFIHGSEVNCRKHVNAETAISI